MSRPRLNTVERNDRFVANLAKVAEKRMVKEAKGMASMTDDERMKVMAEKQRETQKRASVLKMAKKGGYSQKRESLLAGGGGGRRASRKPAKTGTAAASKSGQDLLSVAAADVVVEEDEEGGSGRAEGEAEAESGDAAEEEDDTADSGGGAAEEEGGAAEAPRAPEPPVLFGSQVNLELITEQCAKAPYAPLILSGGTQQERARGTKSLTQGFRKMVWKSVWLELQPAAIEIWKTSERKDSHGRVSLAVGGLQECVVTEGVDDEGAPTFALGLTWDGDGSTALRCASTDMADAWQLAIHHNMMIAQDSVA